MSDRPAREHEVPGGSPESRTQAVLDHCRDRGFALAGVCEARAVDHADEVRAWIDAGRHGSMEWLERRLEERLDPEVYLPGARSIICVADRYHDGGRDRVDPAAPPRGRIARYARGRDYHKVLKRRLVRIAKDLGAAHPGEEFRACVDTAPLMEREHAVRAGLGLVGKHTLLIEPGFGSWLLLGAIVTTLPLAPSTSRHRRADPCGSCTRCIDACPTDAITPFSVDASRCLAYTTIEHRDEIDPKLGASAGGSLEARTGDWLFGCDICQEVCPHGRRSRRRPAPAIHEDYTARRDGIDLLEVLNWDAERAFEVLEGTAARRATLPMWKRNAVVCAGNELAGRPDAPGAAALRGRIEEISTDPNEDEMVRATALRTLARLSD